MYKFTGFTVKAKTALNNAVQIAEDLGHTYIGSEHILIGLAKEGGTIASKVLSDRRITADVLIEQVKSVGVGIPTSLLPMTLPEEQEYHRACSLSRSNGISLGHRASAPAIVHEGSSFAANLLVQLGDRLRHYKRHQQGNDGLSSQGRHQRQAKLFRLRLQKVWSVDATLTSSAGFDRSG